MESLTITALEKALALGEQYIKEIGARPKANALSCIRYLQAAQAALSGLEEEVDEILTEAKIIARFNWERRPHLVERIGNYLNRHKLMKLLGQAIKGIEECHEFSVKNKESFFQFRRVEKATTIDEVSVLLGELKTYLGNLHSAMTYSSENYAGPSGIDMPILLVLEQLLTSNDELKEEEIRQQIISAVDEQLMRRRRKGLQHAEAAAAVIQKLLNSFGVSVDRGG